MTKTLLITGASTGIGEATAHAAASAGWNVALLARSEDKLNALASDIGDRALAVPCDVTDRDALNEAVSKTLTRRIFGSPFITRIPAPDPVQRSRPGGRLAMGLPPVRWARIAAPVGVTRSPGTPSSCQS